jgi:creatinine amidohydrolase
MPQSKVHPSPFWADCATTHFRALQASGAISEVVAVLPVAATEQHGPHLPLKVDTAIVDGVIDAAIAHLAAHSQALFLPTQTVGFSPEHARFAGTLTLKAETVLRLWTELAESVAATGVRKLLIFNAHGGQANLMDLVARDLRARLDMLVFSVNWYALPLASPQGEDLNSMFSPEEQRFGVHAGDLETSMMLAIDSAHVNMAAASSFSSSAQGRASSFDILGNGKTAKFAWQMQDYNPAGAAGNAGAATVEKGTAVLGAAGRSLAALLSEIERIELSTLNNTAI